MRERGWRARPWARTVGVLGSGITALGLMACGGGSAAGTSVPDAAARYARLTGSLQCETNLSTEGQRERAVDLLKAAGVVVLASSCGHDNLLRNTLCGTANGDLFVVDVAGGTAPERLRAAGYTPWAEWPEATVKACAPGR